MLLFSAPLDFDLTVLKDWNGRLLSGTDRILDFNAVTEWVCSPAENRYIGEQELSWFPFLRILATASTGTNHIDLAACARRGIRVISLLDDRAGLETISASAEWTFKLILEGLRLKRPYHELQGKRVGFVGFGRIGQKVAKWCNSMDVMNVHMHDPKFGLASMRLDAIFRNCHVVVICCALTPETTGMIGYDLLKLLPQDAVLVNTSRGEVIDEDALLRVMAERPDLRVCLDVVSGEVTGKSDPSPLRGLGAIVTPHIAGDTFESRTKAARIILKLLQQSAREAGNGAASPVAEAVL